MKVTIVRHGETNYNVKGLCSDKKTKDIFLTDKGIEQAIKKAEELKDYPFDCIVISEMYRTEQTASLINQHHLLPMFIDDRINERVTGFEGRSYKEFHAVLKEIGDGADSCVTDGESFNDVKKRVFAFLDELKTMTQFKHVLIVTHLAIVRLILAYVNNLPDEEVWKMSIDNCESFDIEL